jgi:hypothetical protein
MPILSTIAVCVIAGGVIAMLTVAPTSPVPENVGVLLVDLLPHKAVEVTGATGAVVSFTTGVVVVDGVVLPAGSVVEIATGNTSDPGVVSVHLTIPVASAGVGIQVVPGIVTVAPGSTPLHVTTTGVVPLVGLGVAVQVGATGAVVSGTIGLGIGAVVVFPAGSLTVAVAGNTSDPGVVSVHLTIPVASAGVGTQVVPGIVTVAPGSTTVHVTTFGDVVDEVHVGATGAVLSTTTGVVVVDGVVLPAGSVVEIAAGNTSDPGVVSVQVTFPSVPAGEGIQVVPGIVTVAPGSTPVQLITTVVVPFVGFGTAVHTGAVGAEVSFVNGVVDGVVFPAASDVVTGIVGPVRVPGVVSVQVTLPVASAGVGIQVVPGIVTVAPGSTPIHVTTTAVVPFDGLGTAEHTGATGGVISITLRVIVLSIEVDALLVPDNLPFTTAGTIDKITVLPSLGLVGSTSNTTLN